MLLHTKLCTKAFMEYLFVFGISIFCVPCLLSLSFLLVVVILSLVWFGRIQFGHRHLWLNECAPMCLMKGTMTGCEGESLDYKSDSKSLFRSLLIIIFVVAPLHFSPPFVSRWGLFIPAWVGTLRTLHPNDCPLWHSCAQLHLAADLCFQIPNHWAAVISWIGWTFPFFY